MNVPYQVKVPVAQATKLQDRLMALAAATTEDMQKLAHKIAASKNSEKLDAERLRLGSTVKLFTMTNMIRLSIDMGADRVVALNNEALRTALTQIGIARGRVRAA